MTSKQTRLYWREWGKASKALQARFNKPAGAVEEYRQKLHIKAIGYSVSSKKLTNTQLDKVLAIFSAQYQPDNIDAQIQRNTQADNRIDFRIKTLVNESDMTPAYLNGITQKMFEVDYADISYSQKKKLIPALVLHKKRQNQKTTNPF